MAKTTLQISIPEPCHEDWGKMTPTQCGAFCNACRKEVVDFSQMSEAEIVERLSTASGKVCGRIAADKLDRELVKYEPDAAWYSWKKWAVAAGVLLGINQAKAEEVFAGDTVSRSTVDTARILPAVTITCNKYEGHFGAIMMGGMEAKSIVALKEQPLSKDSIIKLSGTITDPDNEPMADVLIQINGQDVERTITDLDGKYVLTIPQSLHNKSLSITVRYIGYTDTTFSFIADKSLVKNIHFNTAAYIELPMVGAISVRYTPAQRIRNFFRRIGYAFKKHKD